jgi:methylmalonyl-CoA/ethylmalonyl-CoA epimerase
MSRIEAFGSSATLHHVGIAVRSIREAEPDLEPVHDPIQKVSVAFTDLHGLSVELIEPASTESPVSRSLDAGQRLQHVCFEVDDLDESLASGRAAGFHTVARPAPAAAFDGRQIAWVFHRFYGLVELLER